MKKSIWFVLLIVIGSGCSATLSSYNPYNEYVGRTVKFKKNMALWRMEKYQYYKHPYVISISDSVLSSYGKKVAELPIGTLFKLESVVQEPRTFSPPSIIALGRVYVNNEWKECEYSWGFQDSLDRAPWEGEEVPDKRNVGMSGKNLD